ncbi:MAG: SPOR domain-containing protein [Anaerovoracaceae bacterium]|jgi:cell division protein FtsN
MVRYNRGYRPRKRSGSVFTIFVVIVLLAVAAGYAGTKYIIYPIFLQDSGVDGSINSENQNGSQAQSDIDVTTSPPSVTIDSQTNPDENQEVTEQSQEAQVKNDSEQENQAVPSGKGPYTVQFGNFTTREAADSYAKELTQQGIYTYIYEDDSTFKVLGLPYGEKAKAQEAVSVISSIVEDAFVVDMSSL